MRISQVAATVVVGCLAFLCFGCAKNDVESAGGGPPGPAVGTPTKGGGVITIESQHGRRPHMGGAPGK